MHRPFLALLLCVLAPHAASQSIFRCLADDGSLVLQQGPCHGGQDLKPRKVVARAASGPATGLLREAQAAAPARPVAVDRSRPVAVASR